MAPAHAYCVVKFDSKNRFGKNGVPAVRLYSGGQDCVIRMKEATLEKAGKRAQYAKVEIEEGAMEGHLMELLGYVGEYAAELRACQLHFGVKGRRWDYAGSPYRHVMQNPHWVWPLPSEKPPRAKTIDGSAYWA